MEVRKVLEQERQAKTHGNGRGHYEQLERGLFDNFTTNWGNLVGTSDKPVPEEQCSISKLVTTPNFLNCNNRANLITAFKDCSGPCGYIKPVVTTTTTLRRPTVTPCPPGKNCNNEARI